MVCSDQATDLHRLVHSRRQISTNRVKVDKPKSLNEAIKSWKFFGYFETDRNVTLASGLPAAITMRLS
jgi:hypothetical protein